MAGSLDSDLYDDLYGDNEEHREEATQQDSAAEPSTDKKQEEVKQEEKPAPVKKESSLPPKPTQSSELSYSAQVAQQFSAYKQTPAQERQQYQPSSSASGSKANGAGQSDAAYDENGRRVKRPSEMKDEG
ncbi:hypothetical protein FKP32DRAFT_1560872 [Trametes sanguinea]|nr:hypothetical protein FKP32DRAFT_1560872 [Trametes sanguinea]